MRDFFHNQNLSIPDLPRYIQLPRIVVQRDAPRPAWSCGTFAMCNALHLVLGNKHPHELPGGYITGAHLKVLHRALLEWLLAGSPPALWTIGCLNQDIHPPHLAHTGPYARQTSRRQFCFLKGTSSARGDFPPMVPLRSPPQTLLPRSACHPRPR